MSLHIGAAVGEIAETVLISGDPLRIKHMASLFLDECVCFNEIRGMYGYTGFYKGKRVSMMGTGIGIPTTILYLNELATDYNVKNVIRVGTIGAMVPELELGDLILAKSASTDSNINRIEFNGLDYAPTADFEFDDELVGMNLSKSYLPPIEKGIKATMERGAFAGYPMSNVKVIVYDGKEHEVDSKPVAFETSRRMAVMRVTSAPPPSPASGIRP